MLSRLPAMKVDDFQKGDAVILVSTEGTDSAVTAITLVGGVEPILTAAQRADRRWCFRHGVWVGRRATRSSSGWWLVNTDSSSPVGMKISAGRLGSEDKYCS